MTLFETLIVIILLAIISHTAVGFITYALCECFIIFCPKDFMNKFRWWLPTVLVYAVYFIFAPIFAIVGLVVWAMYH